MISPLILGEIGDKVLKLQQKLDDSLIEMVAQEIVKAGKADAIQTGSIAEFRHAI